MMESADELVARLRINHGRSQVVIGSDRGGMTTIQCLSCDGEVSWADAYRCFDCGCWLCRDCVPGHFNNRHEPHPMHLHEYQAEIERKTEALKVVVNRENLMFAECSDAEEILSVCKAALAAWESTP